MTHKLPEPMLRAFTEAEKAAEMGEVPVGAVIADKLGNILAVAGNRPSLTTIPPPMRR